MCLALNIQWELVSFEFMSQLKEFSQALLSGNTDVTKLPTFWKYFSKNNGQQTSIPKYLMYITHDEILGAFYRALGWSHVKGALPASSLFIEFFKSASSPAQE
jgi:hypothetical protein